MNITEEILNKYRNYFYSNDKNIVASNAVVRNGISEACINYNEERDLKHIYSIEVKTGDITNQKSSGRCWMFAALNVMRIEVINKLNLKSFELSQSYPLFYDKLEKSNSFLENIIETIDDDIDSREVKFLLSDPVQDGGQWDMFAAIIKKYGVVPKDAMKESFSSSNTRDLDKYLTLKLREFACSIRELYKSGKSIDEIRTLKDEMMSTIYRMLVISLGEPPKKFDFEVRDKDDKFISDRDITPIEFFDKYVSINLDDYVSIINSPTSDKPFNKTYTVKFLGSVYNNPVKYLNLEINRLKELAISQLKDNKAVWFGSDVGQSLLRKEGIMGLNNYDLGLLFDTKFNMNKAERLDYGESLMTHAMVLLGVNIDNEVSNRWKVENSWGKDVGNDGYFVMSDEWFDEYVYQIVINKKYLSEDERRQLELAPIVLKPWDPMGSLAK